MENSSIASNRQSGIPRGPPRSRTPTLVSPAEEASTQKGPAKSLFEASGAGLSLCAPKVPASFVISSVAQRKLKAGDLKAVIKGSVTLKSEVRERKDGALEITYMAPMSGEYRITLSVGTISVGGSPFRMSCQQPQACETTSVMDLGEASAFAGELFRAKLSVRDQFGAAFCGRTDLAAHVMDGTTRLFAASCAQLGNGCHEVSFQPEISGVYGLAIMLEGRQLPGSPFQIRVRNDETVAANCKLYGGGLTRGKAGARNVFYIQAVDGKQRGRLVGGDKFVVDVSGTAHPAAFVKDAMDGTYEVSWASETAGIYLINITLDGNLIGGCPASCTVHPALLDPARCSASGPGLSHAQAGTPAEFNIATADRFGNPLVAGCIEDLALHIVRADGDKSGAASAAEVSVTGGERGRYKAQFTLNAADAYHVTVTAAGQPIPGSPWTCHVAASEVHPASCRMYGPGLASIQLGRDSQIFVELADRFGNPLNAADVNTLGVKVSVAGARQLAVRPAGADGSTHAFCYRAEAAGTYVISATFHGEHFANSPASVIASVAEADAGLCEIMGTPCQLSAVAGEATEFIIAAKDAAGVKKSLGGDIFKAEWQLASGEGPKTMGKVEDLGTGEYRCQFLAPIAGCYSVIVKHRGDNIAGSPFLATVTPCKIHAACCQVVGEGIAQARSGHRASFVVHPRDRFGNPVAVTALTAKGFQAAIRSQAGNLAPDWASCELQGSTALLCSYTPVSAAALQVQVAYQGASLQHSPWQVQVLPDVANAHSSSLEGLPPSLVAGQPTQLTIHTKDAQGNRSAGGDDVVVIVESVGKGQQSLLVTDHADGTYTAELVLQAGLASLSASVNGQLLGQPVNLTVEPGPLHCLKLQSTLPLAAVAGERMSVFLSGQDAFGNTVAQGPPQLEACLRQSGAADIAADVRDLGQGVFEVGCTTSTAGPFEVNVWISGSLDSAVSCGGVCHPAETCPEHGIFDHLPTGVKAGEQGSFSFWRRDKFGNEAPGGAGKLAFVVQGSGPGHMIADVVESASGQITIRYSATTSGSYNLAVSAAVGGQHVVGSPFAIVVEPAAPAAAFCRAVCSVTGFDATVTVECADRYGNPVCELPASDIEVRTEGPRGEVLTYDGSNSFRKTLTADGTYRVHVTLAGNPLPGCPYILTIQPGDPCASRCTLLGEDLQGLIVGVPAEMTMATLDNNDNFLTSGGHEVDCALACKSCDSCLAHVTDGGNGCYALNFTASAAGVWTLHPRINGEPLRKTGYRVRAVHGPLTAADCAVTHNFAGQDESVSCGETTCITVSPLMSARTFTGDEVVTAQLIGASGEQVLLLGRLAAGGRSWTLKHQWTCAGSYQVETLLDRQPVPGGSFQLTVNPGVLASCEVLVARPMSCTAGQPFRFRFRATDCSGNAVAATGAAFSVLARAGEDRLQGELVSKGVGVFETEFAITRAGKYSIDIARDGSVHSIQGVCSAGALDLDKSDEYMWDDALKAGQTGWLTFQPKDRFGNTIPEPSQHLSGLLASSDRHLTVSQPFCTKEGRIAVTYTTTQAGAYRISLADKQTNERPSFPIQVAPLAASPSLTGARQQVISSLLDAAQAGDEVVITVDLRDKYDNPTKNLGGQHLLIHTSGPGAAVFAKENGDGPPTFRAKFTKAGSYSLAPSLGSVALPSWPHTLAVRPASAARGYLTGAALKGVSCTSPSSVTLHLVDEYGNRVFGDQPAAVTSTLQHEDEHSTIEAGVANAPDGTCALTFILPSPGSWALSVRVNGNLIPGHNGSRSETLISAAWGPLTAADFTLDRVPLAAVCGSEQRIELTAKGREASAVGRVTAVLHSPSGHSFSSRMWLAEGGKSLEDRVTCRTAGKYNVDILFDGKHIPGSPVSFEVHTAGPHAASCIVDGLDPVSCGQASFRVLGRDACGNACDLSLEDVTLHTEPEAALPRIEMQQGEHAVAVTLSGLSQSTLFVHVRGVSVSLSGWQLVAESCGAHSLLFVTEALRTIAGEPVTAMVEALDQLGCRLCQPCPSVSARLVGSNGSVEEVGTVEVGPVRDNGILEISAITCQAGHYQLEVGLSEGSGAVVRCPLTCEPGPASASHSITELPAFHDWRAGATVAVVVTHADRFGNRISAPAPPLTATLSGPGAASTFVRNSLDGVSEVTCAAHTAGTYILAIVNAASLQSIQGSPFQLTLRSGPLSERHSRFSVEGAEAAGAAGLRLEAGRQLELLADLRDKYGNAAEVDGGCLHVMATGPSGATQLEPTEGARLGARLTTVGLHTLSATVSLPTGLVSIPGAHSSASLYIVPGPVCCQRSSLRGMPECLTAGVQADVEVVPVDGFGNPGANGGRFCAALISGDNGRGVECAVTESTTGMRTVAVALLAQQAGEYMLRICHVQAAGGEQQSVAERSIHVEEACACASASYVTGFWPEQGALVGVPAGFIVQARDEFGNKRQAGGDKFVAEVQGQAGVLLHDREDGSYAGSLTLPAEGTYVLSVTLKGRQLAASPASIQVFRNVGALAEQEMQRRLSSTVAGLRRGITAARGLHTSLKSEAASLEGFIPVLVENARSGISQVLRQQEAIREESRAAFVRESAERRRLHNLVQELRGNIRVYVRVKPLTPQERQAGDTSVLRCEGGHRVQCSAAGSLKAFDFDRVFGGESTQAEVFNDVSQLVTSALDGYNVCIFAYGQTGAGKTHTMEGTAQDPGINYRTIQELFRCIHEERPEHSYKIAASLVQIYNEEVQDLLVPGGKKTVELQRSATGFSIPNLTHCEAKSAEEIRGIVARGYEQRTVGCHDINAHSSRSHCLLIVQVTATDESTGIRTVGKLTLCDLAGSERIQKTHATGLTLAEAQNINRSLLELGNVVSALMQQSVHIPYRNSKLTMLLQDSLGGDAKALMIANLAPSAAHAAETLSSLNFAAKVANVVLKTPQRNFEEADAAGKADRTVTGVRRPRV